ncbi:unnamed protein product [Effrenium voratum]|nr:unnamed protein product [Effrenium voratum]
MSPAALVKKEPTWREKGGEESLSLECCFVGFSERYVPPIQHQSACNLCVDYKRVHVSPFQSGTVVQTAASWLNFTSRLRTILGLGAVLSFGTYLHFRPPSRSSGQGRLGSPLDLEGSLEICGTGGEKSGRLFGT